MALTTVNPLMVGQTTTGASGLTATGSGAVTLTTAAGTALSVDSSGRVTTPYQPMFQVAMVSPWSKANGTQTVPFDSESFDIGGNFNTSTFRFTAPVAGKYLFSATVSSNSSSGALSYYGIIFTANGSTFLDGWNRQETSGYMTDSKTMLVDLAANDYVECKLETNLGLTVAAGNSTKFSGFLVG